MDPFSKLPSLIQTEIFIHLQSEISIKKVIQASPSMLWRFVAYKKSVLSRIMNDILHEDTSGDLLRDALGIVYISDKASARKYQETKMWQTMELPGTLKHDQLETLWRLFSRMITFIEDYASKATSVYPPRAYLGIPDIINGNGSYFKGQRLETKVVRFMSLTGTERYRFLRAFARYELLCKIFYPRKRSPEETYTMEKQLIAMSEDSDLTMMTSVHEYYRGVYGALFAHCQDSWLPDIPQPPKTGQSSDTNIPESSRYGLLFPDNTYFSAAAYEEDMEKYGRYLASDLPCVGLDCLSQILLFMNEATGREPILKAWLETLSFRFGVAWRVLLPESLADRELCSYNRPQAEHRGLEQSDEEPEYDEVSMDRFGTVIHKRSPHLKRLHGFQLHIYRQRAWGLFDDDRLYPMHNNHFPTLNEFDQMEKAFQDKVFLAPDLERSRRRSQKWQDYWALRTLEPPEQQCSEEDNKVSTKGYVGPCVRFFSASSGKLPIT
jgi:hypothetical protein